ncbi:MAG TPA: diguanylate cyclase [Pyrinomonadaceae bacterium]|nr:diguanylate cyclase [Pyrinomonadaceae bacterium]
MTSSTSRENIRSIYMWLIAVAGVATVAFCVYSLPVGHVDRRFMILGLAMLIGSRVTIEIPRAKGHISVSDTFVFLTLLLFGGEAAVILAATEALSSSHRFSKKPIVALFNAGVMACSTGITALVVHLAVGSPTQLWNSYSPNLMLALCLMALVQYVFNSGLVAISAALKLNQPLWFTWRTNFLWTSITYFAGASAAAIVARLIAQIGFYAFLALLPIIAIIYLTYRTYLRNVETSAAQAEQARHHVEELNRFIAEQERISKALQESEEHFRTAFDYAAIGMALVSTSGSWLRVNRSLCDIVGYSESELLTSDFQAITHEDDLGNDLAHIYRLMSGEILTCQVEKRYLHKDGQEVWALTSISVVRDSEGLPVHFIFQIEDITERKRAEGAIKTLSLVDELTGLYNRRGFLAFSEQHLISLQRANKSLMMVYADLDGLKQINDSYGHKEGDRALIKTAEILRETFRTSDVLGRLGGDEFTVFATVEPEGGVETVMARLNDKLQKYNSQSNAPYRLSVSVGLAFMHPNENQTVEDLMAQADESMYQNKRQRKASVAWREMEIQSFTSAVA